MSRGPSSDASLSMTEHGDYTVVGRPSGVNQMRLLHAKGAVYTKSARLTTSYIALFQKPKDSKAGHDDVPSPAHLYLGWIATNSRGMEATLQACADVEIRPRSAAQHTILVRTPEPRPTSDFVNTGSSFVVSLSKIKRLEVVPPGDNPDGAEGYITVYDGSGSAFPTLYFDDHQCKSTLVERRERLQSGGDDHWGGAEVLAWIQRYVVVCGSESDHMYYLDPQSMRSPRQKAAKDGRVIIPKSALRQPADDGSGSFPMDILSRFAKVTQLAREAQRLATGSIQLAVRNQQLLSQDRETLLTPIVRQWNRQYPTAEAYLTLWSEEFQNAVWPGERAVEVTELETNSVLGGFMWVSYDRTQGGDKYDTVTMEEWNSWFEGDGSLTHPLERVKERIYYGGLDGDVRPKALPFLLGVFNWSLSAKERDVEADQLRSDYERLKAKAWRFLDGIPAEGTDEWDIYDDWLQQQTQIEKDVHRTDRGEWPFNEDKTVYDNPVESCENNNHLSMCRNILMAYNEFNPGLGYVQGMSDLLTPLYALASDDSIAFWCFAKYMDRMEQNFLRSQEGMNVQLKSLSQLLRLLDPFYWHHLDRIGCSNFFFMYRMILVRFKRELEWGEIMRFWEASWTDFRTSSFHLFFAMAILKEHRSEVLTKVRAFDQMIKFANDLSGNLDLGQLLATADQIFDQFKDVVADLDRRSGLPDVPTTANRPARPTPPKTIPLERAPEEPLLAMPEPTLGRSGRPRSTSMNPLPELYTPPAPVIEPHRRVESGVTKLSPTLNKKGGQVPKAPGREAIAEAKPSLSLELRQLLSRKVVVVRNTPRDR